MKIVIVSHSTYPNQSPRAARTHELATQLAKDHEVVLYVLAGDYDYSEYIKNTGIKVKNLGRPISFIYDPEKGIKSSFVDKVFYKLFHNLFEYPYLELCFLTNKCLKRESDIDLLITIAVPHSIHWGAALFRTKNKTKLKRTIWVADCGDPYMGNPFHKKPFYFEYIEKWFCRQADYLSVPFEGAKEGYYSEFNHKIQIIPQGFNLEGLSPDGDYKKNKVPTFIYAGNFYEKFRDPRPLLDHLLSINKPFKFIIHTKRTKLIEAYKGTLGEKLQVCDYIPRAELINKMNACDFLINMENTGSVQMPSKLIDYILSGRPVLSIDTSKQEQLEKINSFLEGDYSQQLHLPSSSNYDIINIAKKFTSLVR